MRNEGSLLPVLCCPLWYPPPGPWVISASVLLFGTSVLTHCHCRCSVRSSSRHLVAFLLPRLSPPLLPGACSENKRGLCHSLARNFHLLPTEVNISTPWGLGFGLLVIVSSTSVSFKLDQGDRSPCLSVWQRNPLLFKGKFEPALPHEVSLTPQLKFLSPDSRLHNTLLYIDCAADQLVPPLPFTDGEMSD